MDDEHRWLAKTEPGAGGRPASVEKGLGERPLFIFVFPGHRLFWLNYGKLSAA